MTKKLDTVAEEYETKIGERDTAAKPSLSDMFGVVDETANEETWEKMWRGMPKYEAHVKHEKQLTILFQTDEDYEAFVKMVGFRPIRKGIKSVWWPEKTKYDKMAVRFIDDE